MKTTCKLLIIASLLLLYSCKKKDEEVNNNIQKISVGMDVTDLICFPYDSISMTFLIQATNGIPPYSYQWNNPDSFAGAGPFTMNIKSDVTLDVVVSDAKSTRARFIYEIKKDTIDSLKYDYRNSYIGNYQCNVIYRWTIQDSNGIYHGYDTTYLDTLAVSKHEQFDMLKMAGFPEVKYYPNYPGFRGYHTTVTFKDDSVNMYFFLTPVQMFNWTYKGKKLIE